MLVFNCKLKLCVQQIVFRRKMSSSIFGHAGLEGRYGRDGLHSASTRSFLSTLGEPWKRRTFEDPEMNTATTFVDSAFTRLAIFQGGNSSEALPRTCGALKAISPQSSGWNPLQLNNFLHLVSNPHRHPCSIITVLSWHQSPPLSRSLLLTEWWQGGYDNSFILGYNLELN